MKPIIAGIVLTALSLSAYAHPECSKEINIDAFEASSSLHKDLRLTVKQELQSRGFILSSSSSVLLTATQDFSAPCYDLVNAKIENAEGEILFQESYKKCDLGMRQPGRLTNFEKIGMSIVSDIPDCL